MMRDLIPLLLCGLGGTDVETAVDLNGISGDDLPVKKLRKADPKRSLSRGGRAGDDEYFPHTPIIYKNAVFSALSQYPLEVSKISVLSKEMSSFSSKVT